MQACLGRGKRAPAGSGSARLSRVTRESSSACPGERTMRVDGEGGVSAEGEAHSPSHTHFRTDTSGWLRLSANASGMSLALPRVRRRTHPSTSRLRRTPPRTDPWATRTATAKRPLRLRVRTLSCSVDLDTLTVDSALQPRSRLASRRSTVPRPRRATPHRRLLLAEGRRRQCSRLDGCRRPQGTREGTRSGPVSPPPALPPCRSLRTVS